MIGRIGFPWSNDKSGDFFIGQRDTDPLVQLRRTRAIRRTLGLPPLAKETTVSFSVTFVGKPEAIKRKLAEESARLTGQSKTEFDAVKPALETILDQQVGNGAVHLSANGHATFTDGAKTYGNCQVDVKSLGQIAE